MLTVDIIIKVTAELLFIDYW